MENVSAKKVAVWASQGKPTIAPVVRETREQGKAPTRPLAPEVVAYDAAKKGQSLGSRRRTTAHPTPLDSVCIIMMQIARTSSRRPHRKPMLPRLCETLAGHLARTC